MAKQEKVGINVKKNDNLSEWYQQLVLKAELAEYSPVKGFMVIRPRGYYIWERIQDDLNKRISKKGVDNAYFPLLIPESFFKKEAKHAKGFKPEVAWVANREEERLAIRPTSETIMYDSYSRWIRSWRDLPLRINQWCNVIRWETKATRLFLRTREFLWQEGHCVYETKKGCDKETMGYLEDYEKLCKELLCLPVIKGKKSESEKFAGAYYTLTIESIMPDGKSLQCGTSHNLGQGFAESFGINFLDRNEKKALPWQNSWGISTRLIGALSMVHGDDKGLVLPPKIVKNKVVVVPIIFDKEKEKVLVEAKKIVKSLKKCNAILDDREGYSAGWKFNEWELKGIPIRIEIGPKDLVNKEVILVRRDNGKKEGIKIKDLSKKIDEELNNMQKDLYENAKKLMDEKIVSVGEFKELEKAINDKKVGKTGFCGDVKCESKFDPLNAKVLCIDFKENKCKCVVCGKETNNLAYIGKSY